MAADAVSVDAVGGPALRVNASALGRLRRVRSSQSNRGNDADDQKRTEQPIAHGSSS